MSKAVKAAVASLVVLAVAWSGASWQMGKRVEQELLTYVEQFDAGSQPWGLTITRYERGWFSSKVQFTLSTHDFPTFGLLERDSNLPLHMHIAHGPLPLSQILRGEFAPALAAMHTRLRNEGMAQPLFAATQGKEPLEDRSRLTFGGEFVGTTHIAPVQFQEDDLTIDAKGARIDYRVAANLDTIVADATLGDIQVRNSGLPSQGDDIPAELRIDDTSLALDYRRGRFDIHLGKAQVRMGTITVDSVDEAGQPITLGLQDYVLDTVVGEDEQNLNARIDYTIGSARMMGMNLGQMGATLRVGNLNGETLRGIVADYRQIESRMLREIEAMPADSDEIPPLLSAFLERSLTALLPGRPAFGVDPVRWSLPGGESSMRLNVTLREAPADSDPDDFLRQVQSLDGSLVISRGMVLDLIKTGALASGAPPATDERLQAEAESTFALLRQLALATGYLVQEGDNLVMRLSYADGQIRLNGEQSTLEELLQSLPL